MSPLFLRLAHLWSHLMTSPTIHPSACRLRLQVLEDREVPSVTALADAFTVHQGKTLDVLAPGVLANDSSSNGYTLTASLVSGVSHGTLTLLTGGRFQYRPSTGYVGPDSFTYQVSDGHGGTAQATVNLTVTNDPPVGVGDSYAVTPNTSLYVSATAGLLANDSDTDNDRLNAVLVSGPSRGQLWLTYNGSFTYTPTPGYAGPDSFTYKVVDGAQESGPVTVGLNAAGASPPRVQNDLYSAMANQSLTVSAPGVLANDSDPSGGSLTAVQISGPSSGTLSLDGDGSFTYTPNAGFTGTDTFSYRVSNGTTQSGTAMVTITVLPVVSVEKVSDAAESGGRGLFRFTRTGDVSQALKVSYTIQTTGTGNATPNDDYIPLNGTTSPDFLHGTVTFAPGSSTAELLVVAVDDANMEPSEAVSIVLDGGTMYAVGGGSATVTIADNDPADPLIEVVEPLPPVFVQVNSADTVIDLTPVFFPLEEVVRYEVVSSNPSLVGVVVTANTLTLSYAPGLTGNSTVTVTAFDRTDEGVSTTFDATVLPVSSVTASGPPEVAVGADYTLTLDPGGEDVIEWSIDWGDGTTSTVPGDIGLVLADHQYSSEGRYVIVAAAITQLGRLPAIPLVTLALDPTLNPRLWVIQAQPNQIITEGAAGANQQVQFVIKSRIPLPVQFQVDYTTLDGSAVAGSDYVAKSGTLTFMPGDSEKTVTITVNGDNTIEPDEEFYLALKLPAFVNGKPSSRFTPVGRGFIKNDDFPNGINDKWSAWETAPYTSPGTSYEVGLWRKTVDGMTTTMTTPKGVPWSSSMTDEGPYLKTTDDQIGSFRFTVEYRTLDADKVPPMPPSRSVSQPLAGNNQHYSNSGVYIFNRYEIQIVDPSKWGVMTGAEIANEPGGPGGKPISDRNQLLPGGVYGVEMSTVSYTNRAKSTGEWNTLVIEFDPGKIDNNDPKKLSTAAWVKVTLNGQVVTKGELKDGNLNLIGTGSRGRNATSFPPLEKGAIFLQSHWGSQAEFRNPSVEKVAITRN